MSLHQIRIAALLSSSGVKSPVKPTINDVIEVKVKKPKGRPKKVSVTDTHNKETINE